jgi:hypothetical protein
VNEPSASDEQAKNRESVLAALLGDRTVDIITTGARTGSERTTEIWTTIIGGEVFLCGTPNASLPGVERKPRDWLANLIAHPRFILRLKSTTHADLTAEAQVVSDAGERQRIMSAPATEYYRSQAKSIEHAARDSPIVRLRFVEGDAWLTDAVRDAGADRS